MLNLFANDYLDRLQLPFVAKPEVIGRLASGALVTMHACGATMDSLGSEVRLFCTKLFQFIREGALGIRPTHIAIVLDKSEESFRKEIYPEYKANRQAPPDDFAPQEARILDIAAVYERGDGPFPLHGGRA